MARRQRMGCLEMNMKPFDLDVILAAITMTMVAILLWPQQRFSRRPG